MSLVLALALAAGVSATSTNLQCTGPAKFGQAVARDDRSPRLYTVDGKSIGMRKWSQLKIEPGAKVNVYAITTRELIAIADKTGAQKEGACLFVNRGAFDFQCSCRLQVSGGGPVQDPDNTQISGSRQSGLQMCPQADVTCPR